MSLRNNDPLETTEINFKSDKSFEFLDFLIFKTVERDINGVRQTGHPFGETRRVSEG